MLSQPPFEREGIKIDEEMYYEGANLTLAPGVKLVYGAKGVVTGPGTTSGRLKAMGCADRGIMMQFPDIEGVGVLPSELSRTPVRRTHALYPAGSRFECGSRIVHCCCVAVHRAGVVSGFVDGFTMMFNDVGEISTKVKRSVDRNT